MAIIAKKHSDRLPNIKEKVREWELYNKENVDRYHKFMKAVHKSSLTEKDKQVMNELNKPDIEVNGLETYLSRLRGNMAEQTPDPMVNSTNPTVSDSQEIEFFESHLRLIQDDANKNQFNNEIWKDTLGGGFSVATIWTEYENDHSFNQEIKMGRVFDPTLCGFDPIARYSTKSDGGYCFEIFPMYLEEAENQFRVLLEGQTFITGQEGFSWFYKAGTKKIVLVCHFYEKQYTEDVIYFLASSIPANQSQVVLKSEYDEMIKNWNDITEPPQIIQQRKTKIQTIVRYTLVGNQILEFKKTDFTELPYVFIDGNSVMLREDAQSASYQMTRPLVYHAMGMQRLKNFLAQSFLQQVQSISQNKWQMGKSAFPKESEFRNGWLNPQKPSVLIYEDYDEVTQQPIAPPQQLINQPIPPEIFSAFMSSDESIRNILSAFDPNVALNSNDISGKAVIEGITQSNATAMPYMFNYLSALNQLFRIIVDLMPKYYATPRSVPILDKDGRRDYKMINVPSGPQIKGYDAKSLNISVETGVNFDIEKEKAVNILGQLSQTFPAFGQFINTAGIGFLLDNIDMDGIEQLKELYSQSQEKMQEQQSQQAQQPNPAMIEMQIKAKKSQSEAQTNQMKVQLDAERVKQDQQRLVMDQQKMQADIELAARNQSVELVKAQTERMVHAADFASKTMDHHIKLTTLNKPEKTMQH